MPVGELGHHRGEVSVAPEEDGAALGAQSRRRPAGDVLQQRAQLEGRGARARDVEERRGLLRATALLLERARLADGERGLLGQARQGRFVPGREGSRRAVEGPEQRDHLACRVEHRRDHQRDQPLVARPLLDGGRAPEARIAEIVVGAHRALLPEDEARQSALPASRRVSGNAVRPGAGHRQRPHPHALGVEDGADRGVATKQGPHLAHHGVERRLERRRGQGLGHHPLESLDFLDALDGFRVKRGVSHRGHRRSRQRLRHGEVGVGEFAGRPGHAGEHPERVLVERDGNREHRHEPLGVEPGPVLEPRVVSRVGEDERPPVREHPAGQGLAAEQSALA